MKKGWFTLKNAQELPTPALVFYEDRIDANIRKAVKMAGTPARLRPHVKTHKCPEIIRKHLALGVKKFKCATIAEAEMTAQAGAEDVLIAQQILGPHVPRFGQLRTKFPGCRFSVIIDDPAGLIGLGTPQQPVPVYLDIDCGMGRTGAPTGARAVSLYKVLSSVVRHVIPAGLHIYDGHIHDADPEVRLKSFERTWKQMGVLLTALKQLELPVPNLVAGGTPTFPFHAKQKDRECSPGTYVLWDFGYQQFTDLKFQPAALVLARVVSKAEPNRLCLDLGYKAIASENPHPRVQFLNLPDAKTLMHNEEHLVIESKEATKWKVGDILYGIPRHICPTVAMHDHAYVATDGKVNTRWEITARRRTLTI